GTARSHARALWRARAEEDGCRGARGRSATPVADSCPRPWWGGADSRADDPNRVAGMVDLGGKVAVVTGAGSGIGRACAVAFGAAGAAVVANDLVPDGLDTTLAEVEAAGGAAVSAVGDVRSPADVRGLVELASSKFGGLAVMVAN